MTAVYEVRATPLAQRQIAGLRRTVLRRYEQVEEDIAARGCAAFHYRLTGTGVDHFCDRHLSGPWRVIAAFAPDDVIWVLLVAQHLDKQPEVDVYRALYQLAGVTQEPRERRTKPSCCDPEGLPPGVDENTVLDLYDRSRQLTRRRQK